MHLGAKTVPIDSRVATVLAELSPIASRRELLDSYRREAVRRALPIDGSRRAEERILEIAYSLRWAELETDELMGGPSEADVE